MNKNELFNKDINLNDTGHGYFDIQINNKELDIVTGLDSVENGIIIAILTRFNELKKLPSYSDFGCRVYELIKAPATKLNQAKVRNYIKESVNAMNRISSVDKVTLTPTQLGYNVMVECTTINGNLVRTEVTL